MDDKIQTDQGLNRNYSQVRVAVKGLRVHYKLAQIFISAAF